MRDALREAPSPEPDLVSTASAADAFVASATSPTQAVAREERGRVSSPPSRTSTGSTAILALRHSRA
jgi:hypothetical protein